MVQNRTWLRPGVVVFLLGIALCVVAIAPELFLTEFLLSGRQFGSLALTVVNRLIGMATVTGSALCAAGVVLEVCRWLDRRDPARDDDPT